MDCSTRSREFVERRRAMGLRWTSRRSRDADDGIRVDLSGEAASVLSARGEALDALQQIVNTGVPPRARRRPLVRRRLHRLPQGQGRRAAADGALHRWRRRSRPGPQEMGPLNPYARRLVHLTVAEDRTMSSESIGDAFLKTVIISKKRRWNSVPRQLVRARTSAPVCDVLHRRHHRRDRDAAGRGGIGVVRLSGPDARARSPRGC
jgi:spoIIIJ-associated protein